jgi:hypothetical protein
LGGSEILIIPFISINMTGLNNNASKHNSEKQEDAGDDNL